MAHYFTTYPSNQLDAFVTIGDTDKAPPFACAACRLGRIRPPPCVRNKGQTQSADLWLQQLSRCAVDVFFGLPGGADSHLLATHSNQTSPTAGGPRQGLTSEIRPTPLSQEVPSARIKIAWELNPHTSLVCYSDCWWFPLVYLPKCSTQQMPADIAALHAAVCVQCSSKCLAVFIAASEVLLPSSSFPYCYSCCCEK